MEMMQSYLAAGGLMALTFALLLVKSALKRYALQSL